MAIDFPSSPTTGQAHAGHVWSGTAWNKAPLQTALPKNYIVNPAMQISQQNGDATGTANAYYAADQWLMAANSGGTGAASGGRTAWQTPRGSINRLRISINSPQATLVAGSYLAWAQYMEGQRTADLQWGTAGAKPIVVRFGVNFNSLLFPIPWRFAVAVRNRAYTRSYIKTIEIPDSRMSYDEEYTLSIPGETTGVWATDNSCGLELWFTFATGSTYHSPIDGGWANGSFIGHASQDNGYDSADYFFDIFDVGLYADPYNTGIAPPFEIPVYAHEMRRCQRYWHKAMAGRGWQSAATTANRLSSQPPVPMRAAPSVTLGVGMSNAGAQTNAYDGTAQSTTLSVAANNTSNAFVTEWVMTTSTLTAARPGGLISNTEANCVLVNTRP